MPTVRRSRFVGGGGAEGVHFPNLGVHSRPVEVHMLLSSMLFLMGCPVEPDKTTDDKPSDLDTGDTGTPNKETGETGDSAGELLPPPTIDALVASFPGTLPASTGGELTVLAKVAVPEGAVVEYADPAYVFTIELSEGKDVPVKIGNDDGYLSFSFTVPAGLPVGRQAHSVSMNGVPFMEIPVPLSADATDISARLTRPGVYQLEAELEADFRMCGSWALDSDADGVVEIVTLGVRDQWLLVTRACPVDGAKCVENQTDLSVQSKNDLYCGDTSHFRTDSGGIGIAATMTGATGELLVMDGFEYEGGAWTGTGNPVLQTAIFGAVLGINTSKERESVPTITVLGLNIGGGNFVVTDATQTSFHESIGGVSGGNLLKGTGWAGTFSPSDLSGEALGSDAWLWSLDGSTAEKGSLTGTVALPVWETESLSTVRTFSLTTPDFSIETMTASGEDIDDDGHPELFVEAWGEGRHTTWVVMGATDKSNTLPVRTLSQPCGGTEDGDLGCTWAATGRIYEDVGLLFSDSALTVNGGSILFSGFLVDENADPLATQLDSSLLAVKWDLSDVLVDDATEVAASGTSFVGTPRLRKVGGLCDKGKGMAGRGTSACMTGWVGNAMTVLGGGSGSDEIDAELTAGDLILMGPSDDGTSAIVRRAFNGVEFPELKVTGRADYGAGEVVATLEHFSEGWARVTLLSRNEPVHSDSHITILGGNFETYDDSSFLLLSEEDVATGTVYVSFLDEFAELHRYVLPNYTTTNGSSRPVLLSERLSVDNGALISWRDGKGQTWIGLAGLDDALAGGSDELPFLEGPFALGQPVLDTENLLGLSTSRPAAIAMRTRPFDAAPLYKTEKTSRMLDETAVDGVWDCTTACLESVLITVGGDGSNECPFETVYLPAAQTLAEMTSLLQAWSKSADKTCSDLKIPLSSFTPVADAPQFSLSATASGEVYSTLHAGNDLNITIRKFVTPKGIDVDTGTRVSAGDLNGDGLSDFQWYLGGTAETALSEAMISDGRGGFTESGIDPAMFTTFSLLLGGMSTGKEECWDSDWTSGGVQESYGTGTYLDTDDYPTNTR